MTTRGGMLLEVELVDPEESFEVRADQRDFREWEAFAMSRKPPLPMKPGEADFPQSMWVARLAFSAARRDELVDNDWAKWDKRCVGVAPVEEAKGLEDADPTQEGPLPGPSASSQ